MVMATRDLTCDVSAKKRKNVLHDIYNSEELEIDSEQSKGLKKRSFYSNTQRFKPMFVSRTFCISR